jgi:hypothetical protein
MRFQCRQVLMFICLLFVPMLAFTGCGPGDSVVISRVKLPLAEDKLTFIFFYGDH